MENSLFSKWEVLFPRINLAANKDKILWSNGVCCSRGISFRWHFWYIHFLSNNVIKKNKVLSYHGLNSRKSSTVADYLHFPSNENTIIYFFILLFYEFWYFPFLECIATISKRTTTHFILSHHVRLKVANSHTMSYFCGSWWQGTFTAQYTIHYELKTHENLVK